MEWNEQGPVTYAVLISAAAVLLCLVLAFGRRRREQVVPALAPATPPRLDLTLWPEHESLRQSIIAAVALVAVTTIAVSPLMGAVAVLVAADIIWFRRPAAAGIASVILMAGLAAAVTGRKLLGGTEAGAPGRARLHGPGMLIVVMLVIAVFFGSANRDRD